MSHNRRKKLISSVKAFWKKHRLAHPVDIVRRTMALPFVFVGIVFTTAVITLGWGWEEGKLFFDQSV